MPRHKDYPVTWLILVLLAATISFSSAGCNVYYSCLGDNVSRLGDTSYGVRVENQTPESLTLYFNGIQTSKPLQPGDTITLATGDPSNTLIAKDSRGGTVFSREFKLSELPLDNLGPPKVYKLVITERKTAP
jgi:hypothetical protein